MTTRQKPEIAEITEIDMRSTDPDWLGEAHKMGVRPEPGDTDSIDNHLRRRQLEKEHRRPGRHGKAV